MTGSLSVTSSTSGDQSAFGSSGPPQTPAILVGGGSGIVPLMAMLRLARQSGQSDLVRMAVSVQTPDDLYYANELPGPETTVAYTRAVPPSFMRPPSRLTEHDLAPLLLPTRPPSCAARPASPTSPVGCCWASANPWKGSELSGSAPPVSSQSFSL